jgi:hypothetical protein
MLTVWQHPDIIPSSTARTKELVTGSVSADGWLGRLP